MDDSPVGLWEECWRYPNTDWDDVNVNVDDLIIKRDSHSWVTFLQIEHAKITFSVR